MNASGPALVAMAFGFMLVIARVGSALLAGPGLGENEVPATIRIGLAAVLAILVFPALQHRLPAMPGAFGPLVALLGIEILIGLWLGLITRVMVAALAMAGNLLSLTIGLSNVLQIDPGSGTQVPALQRMLTLAAVALFFVGGLYLYPLQAIVGSYDLIAPGGSFDTGGAAELVVKAATGSFSLAIRLAAPLLITSMVWHAALGFLSRLVPHIHVHQVSAPAQILGGMALLAAGIATVFAVWSQVMADQMSGLPGL
jgi:flagellar biosynthetic protein FliR